MKNIILIALVVTSFGAISAATSGRAELAGGGEAPSSTATDISYDTKSVVEQPVEGVEYGPAGLACMFVEYQDPSGCHFPPSHTPRKWFAMWQELVYSQNFTTDVALAKKVRDAAVRSLTLVAMHAKQKDAVEVAFNKLVKCAKSGKAVGVKALAQIACWARLEQAIDAVKALIQLDDDSVARGFLLSVAVGAEHAEVREMALKAVSDRKLDNVDNIYFWGSIGRLKLRECFNVREVAYLLCKAFTNDNPLGSVLKEVKSVGPSPDTIIRETRGFWSKLFPEGYDSDDRSFDALMDTLRTE